MLNTSKIRYIIPVIWVAGFGFASPSTFVIHLNHNKEVDVCVEWWPPPFNQEESPKHYTVILFMFLYVIPLLLMSTIYLTIAQKMAEVKHNNITRKLSQLKLPQKKSQYHSSQMDNSFCLETTIHQNHYKTREVFSSLHPNQNEHYLTISYKSISSEQQKNLLNNTAFTTTGTASDAQGGSSSIRKHVWQKPRPRVITMLVTIVASFAICWFPVFLIQFLIYFHPYFMACPSALPEWAFVFGFFLHYCNGAITPLLYFGYSFSYRKGFKETFRH